VLLLPRRSVHRRRADLLAPRRWLARQRGDVCGCLRVIPLSPARPHAARPLGGRSVGLALCRHVGRSAVRRRRTSERPVARLARADAPAGAFHRIKNDPCRQRPPSEVSSPGRRGRDTFDEAAARIRRCDRAITVSSTDPNPDRLQSLLCKHHQNAPVRHGRVGRAAAAFYAATARTQGSWPTSWARTPIDMDLRRSSCAERAALSPLERPTTCGGIEHAAVSGLRPPSDAWSAGLERRFELRPVDRLRHVRRASSDGAGMRVLSPRGRIP